MLRARIYRALARRAPSARENHRSKVRYLAADELAWPPDAMHADGDVAYDVPIAACVYPYGAAYDPGRWHPFTATLRELRDGAGPATYTTSVLHRYYATFRPSTLLELLFPADVVAAHPDAALGKLGTRAYEPILPWSGRLHPPHGEKGLGVVHGHQGFGPVSDAKGRLEFQRLLDVYRSLEREGFDPTRGRVTGTFVVRGGAYRFVVGSGFHRLAALSVLGVPSVRARFEPHHLRGVHAELADRWPLVRRGVFDAALARTFVDHLFDRDRFSEEVAPRVEPTWARAP